jgi:V/A-type H+/Na+-transporting ATPase subunit D
MAKIRLTRPELKKQRDALQRYQRFLPTLKLKQQQLQLTLRQVAAEQREAHEDYQAAEAVLAPYRAVLRDVAGVNIPKLSEPAEVRTSTENIAGVTIPVLEGIDYPEANYSLFATPPWVDRALADSRTITLRRTAMTILDQRELLLQQELTKIIQRVNLFEKVKIPDSQEAIRRIRIRLGDEMTAAVGRAKIAKGKLGDVTHQSDEPDGHGPAEVAPAPTGDSA